MTTGIKIYVADLAAYNSSILHGVWIDATLDVEDIQDQISAMLAASLVEDAEGYAIHDHEGFGGYDLHEYAGIKTAHEIALFLEEYDTFGGALLNHLGDRDDAKKAASDNYRGCYTSLADYIQELTEESTEIPESLRSYIDYQAMARDMEMNGEIFTVETSHREVHIFLNDQRQSGRAFPGAALNFCPPVTSPIDRLRFPMMTCS